MATITLPLPALRDLLSATLPATDDLRCRYALARIRLYSDAAGLTAEATDGRRLHRVRAAVKNVPAVEFFIPRKAARKLAGTSAKCECRINVEPLDSRSGGAAGSVSWTSRHKKPARVAWSAEDASGRWPNTDEIYRSLREPRATITGHADALRAAFKPDRCTQIKVNGSLRIGPPTRRADEIRTTGRVILYCDIQFLSDALKFARDETTISIRDADHPIRIRDAAGSTDTVLMPMAKESFKNG